MATRGLGPFSHPVESFPAGELHGVISVSGRSGGDGSKGCGETCRWAGFERLHIFAISCGGEAKRVEAPSGRECREGFVDRRWGLACALELHRCRGYRPLLAIVTTVACIKVYFYHP